MDENDDHWAISKFYFISIDLITNRVITVLLLQPLLL